MKRKVNLPRFIIILINTAIVATSCTSNINTVNQLQKAGKSVNTGNISRNNISLTEKEISSFEQEYRSFTTKALTQNYFNRKLDFFLTAGNGAKLLKDLIFAQIKNPLLARAYFTNYPLKHTQLLGKTEITARMAIDPTFANFMRYNLDDPDAGVFNTAAGITDPSEINAINFLVIDLKAAGIWAKMKAVYPFVGNNAVSHKFNLKDPRDSDNAFRLVFNGNWVHTATGALPDGTTSYADTKFSPLNNGFSAQNNHLSYYSRTSTGYLSDTEIGAGDFFGSDDFQLHLRRPDNTAAYDVYGYRNSYSNSDGKGFYVGKANSAFNQVFKNGILQSSLSLAGASRITASNLYLGAYNYNNVAQDFGNKECAFASIGDGFTDDEVFQLYSIVQAFETALGRQV